MRGVNPSGRPGLFGLKKCGAARPAGGSPGKGQVQPEYVRPGRKHAEAPDGKETAVMYGRDVGALAAQEALGGRGYPLHHDDGWRGPLFRRRPFSRTWTPASAPAPGTPATGAADEKRRAACQCTAGGPGKIASYRLDSPAPPVEAEKQGVPRGIVLRRDAVVELLKSAPLWQSIRAFAFVFPKPSQRLTIRGNALIS